MMSIHTKVMIYAALACHIAVSSMIFISADPEVTPTMAALLAPFAWGVSVGAAVFYAIDILVRWRA